jgi:RHS repeat-associated protein
MWSTDGFGVTNNYTYSQGNEVQSITSSLNDSHDPPHIVANVQNGPFGPVSWQLGNGLCAARQNDAMGRITGGSVRQGASLPSCTGGTQVYGFTASWAGPYLSSACDGVPNTCGNYQYDEFGRLSAANIYQGSGASFSYVYDRWGNRWRQNVTAGSGPQPQLSFNTGNNQITNSGYVYDAAGNLMADGSSHTYSHDADGNLTLVDGGTTSKNTYDAENQRVRIDNPGKPSVEFVFNPFGQRASLWDATDGWQSQGQTYWGSTPVEFYNNGYAHFQHQNWLGTERAATNNTGQVEGTYSSLAFGDGFSVSGTDDDPYHFAGLDYDFNSGYTGTAHAQFRQYANDAGRWMSPDPYGGSYNVTNPQSLNRYAYVGNNPLSAVDSIGLKMNNGGGPDPGGGGGCDSSDPSCDPGGCEHCEVTLSTTRKTIEIYRSNEIYDIPPGLRERLHAAIMARCKKGC